MPDPPVNIPCPYCGKPSELESSGVDIVVRCFHCRKRFTGTDPRVQRVWIEGLSYRVRCLLFREVLIVAVLIWGVVRLLDGCLYLIRHSL